jgi:methylated-DNA-protein-cysteine methyltransferase-like protein
MKENIFFEQVWELTRQIPEGRVTSYGAIAKALGANNLSRMVARAMGSCRDAQPPVPYYRVVSSDGRLTGDPASAGRRQALLAAEGVAVKALKVLNFKQVCWDPLKELE